MARDRLTVGRATPLAGPSALTGALPSASEAVHRFEPPRPRALRLFAAIAVYEKDDPAVGRRLATLQAAASDFLRVVAALPDDLPPDLRAAVDAVTERF